MKQQALQPTLAEIVSTLNAAEQFEAVVLASADGLPVAAAPAGYDSDLAAALVALLRKVSSETQSELGLAEVDEMTVRSRDRTCLVCRRFAVSAGELILVAIVPPGRRYRRATNQAIAQIKALLS